MRRDELRQALKKLQDHLETTGDLDPELESILKELDYDIHALLDKDEPDGEEASFLLQQAQAADARFAAKHPQLEAVFREVINALARMGI
jgi:hypothetical protein